MIYKTLFFALISVTIATPNSKLEAGLEQLLNQKTFANVFIKFEGENESLFRENANLDFVNRGAKISHLVDNLKMLAEKSQGNAMSLLNGRSNDFKQFWISNELYIRQASLGIIISIAALPEVIEIRQEQVIPALPIIFSNVTINTQSQWNLEKVEAPQAWELFGGNNGSGAVVANIDSGVRRTHEVLRSNFREVRGWFDPYYSTQVPSDETGHGTHCMGTLAGSGGIGVAPGAQWIACKGCSSASSCTEKALKECGQWITCPTDANGNSPDCSKAPNVVSNSWGGGQGGSFYKSVIDTWHAANIIPVFSIGNSGPSCGSANSPGDSVDVIAVGSTTSADKISSFSSVGPSVAGRLKPDVTAPGQLIRSAWHTSDTTYNTISGTSMACPHVAGGVAIFLARNPNLTFSQVKQVLEENADKNRTATNRVCGGISSTQFPNNHYGHGRLNVRKSLEAVINNNYGSHNGSSSFPKCSVNINFTMIIVFYAFIRNNNLL